MWVALLTFILGSQGQVNNCDLYDIKWDSSPSNTYWNNRAIRSPLTVYKNEGDITITKDGVTKQTSACSAIEYYGLGTQPSNGTVDATLFSANILTGTITIQDSGAHNSQYNLQFHTTAWRNRNGDPKWINGEKLEFTVNYIDRCATTTLSSTTLSSVSIVVKSAAATKTVLFQDAVSVAKGSADGAAFCGARSTTITGSTYSSWLSLVSSTNTFTASSSDSNDAGSYTVNFQQCLVSYPTICATGSFDVLIQHCQLNSLTYSSSVNTAYWLAGDIRNLVVQVYQGVITIPNDGVILQSSACGYALEYLVTVVGTPTLFTYYPSTGIINVKDTGVHGTVHTVTLEAKALDLRTNTYKSAADVSFTVTYNDDCLSTAFTDTGSTLAPDITISRLQVYSAATDYKTVSFKNTVANAKSNTAYCGDHQTTLISASQTWLTVYSTANSFRVESTSISDVGAVVQYKVCLVRYPAICTATKSFTVTINPCQVTSLTATNAASYTGQTLTLQIGASSYTESFPTYTQSPACGYAIENYFILEGSASAPSPPFSHSSSTASTFTVQKTVRTESTHLITFKIELDTASCAGVCQHSTIQKTYTFQDKCRSATLTVETINPMTSSVSAGASTNLFAEFKDSVSNSEGTMDGLTYCGARTYTIDYPGFLSISGTTITLNSVTASDATNSPYTATVTAGLANWSTVPTVTKTFTVTIGQCTVTSITQATSIYDRTIQEYILMGPAKEINFPTYTQNPACGYALTYSVTKTAADASSSAYYPAGTSYTDAYNYPVPVDVVNLANIETVDTSTKMYKADIKTKISPITNLDSYQYQGDYLIKIQASYSGNAPIGDFGFILRVTNPCLYSSFTTKSVYALNTLTAPVIAQIDASVRLSKSVTFPEFTDAASAAYTTIDDYTMCGGRTYTIDGTTPTWLTLNSAMKSLTVYTRNNADISYTGYGGGCYSVILKSQLNTYPGITQTQTVIICIEECKPTSFTSVARTSTNESYTIFDGQLRILTYGYIQAPACGYSIVYSAKIAKTLQRTLMSSATYTETDLTDTSHTYILFQNPIQATTSQNGHSQLLVYSQSTLDSGDYQITITAVLQETKYSQTLNTNSNDVFELTIKDPCETAQINDFLGTTSPYYRKVSDMQILVKGGPASFYIYQFIDSVSQVRDGSYTWDGISNPFVSNLNAGTTTCGKRKYTLGGDYVSTMTWLTTDWDNGFIKAESISDADINYSGNTNKGYKITLQGCLEFYPTRCSSVLTFYVKISECQIISFLPTAGQTQPDIVHNIYAPELTQNIISYTQSPLCGWTITYSAKVDSVAYSSSAFPWLSLDQSPARYRIYSTNIAEKGLKTITQYAILNNKINGAAISTTSAEIFTIQLTDPCETTTIQSQSADDELFSSLFITNKTAKLTTSVLYGTDTVSSGISVKYEFPIHNDTSSNNFQVPSKQFACGDRTYKILSLERNSIVASPNPTFLTNSDVNATTSQMVAITASDADIGLWKVAVEISLDDYDFSVYPSTVLTEYFYVSIEYCIINEISNSTLGSAAYVAKNPLTPFTYDLFKLYASELQLPTYTIKPACNYTIKYKLAILPYKTLATEANLGLKNSGALTTKLSFDSDDKQLDNCTYGVNDTNTGQNNLRLCGTINPYHVNFVAYVDDTNVNSKSVTKENNQTEFYVWPKDPCRNAVLTPEYSINQNVTIKYFLNGVQIDTPFNKTTDNVTMSAQYGAGRSQCGLLNYMIVQKLFDEAGPVSTTVKQTSSPVITTYSDNYFFAGLQEQRVKSWLADYDFVTAYSDFKVIVYQVLSAQTISVKYYQIAKKKLELNIEAFTISPVSTEFELLYSYMIYKMPEETQLLVSPGVTFDPVTMKVEVFTRDFLYEGQYKVQIRAQAIDALTKVVYSSLGTLDFELIITRDAPPISITPAPVFTQPLEEQKFYYGKEMPPYKLPQSIDPSGFVIETEVVKKPSWLIYDEESQTFSVQEGATTDKEKGYYTIQVKLSNSGGGSEIYEFTVHVEEPIVQEIVEEVKEQVDISPIPRISKVSERGVITISWSKAIKIPRNLTFTRLVNTTYFDKNTSQYLPVPGLYIEVNSGGVTPKKNLNFQWYYKSWNSKAIEIQLVFDNPLLVSHAEKYLDWFKIIFYDERLFIDSRQNQKVKGGPDPEKGHVLQAELPAQIPIVDPPAEAVLSPAATVAAEIGQVVFQLTLSYFLNSLWSMVSTQQLIVLIPLFKIELPSNAGEFFAYMMQIAAFDIIPMDLLFDFLFGVDVPGPITENFGTVGFGTTFFFYNLGSLVLALFSFPVLVAVSQVLKRCYCSRSLVRRGVKIERSIYWNQTIEILGTSYTILIVCSNLQLIALDWTSWPTCLMSGFAIYYFFLCIIFPFFQAFWCYKNLHRLRDKDFKKRWKSMYDGKIIYDENAGKPTTGFIYYNFMYIARRFMLGMIVVHFRDTLFFQISGLAFQTIMAVIVSGWTNSFKDKRLNKLEYFNEVMILMCMYNVMCFTDFQPDQEIQYLQGWFMIFCVLFHIAFNLSFVFVDEIWRLKAMFKKYRLMRKHAKSRGERNRRLQKKKRHDKWLQQTAKILKREIRDGKLVKPVEKPMNENHDMSYEMQQVSESGDISISSIDQSNQDINQNDNQNLALVSRVPVDASEAIVKQVKEFDDGAGKVDYKDFGRQINREFKKDFEQDVHKQLARPVPLDPYFDDLQKVFEQDEPEEWKQLKLVDRLARPAPKDKDIAQPDPSSQINTHNRLARPTNVDFKKHRQVQPVFKKGQGVRAKVNEQAVHDRLFVQLDRGDGIKMSSQQVYNNKKSKRKYIVEPTLPRDYEPAKIIVPILRENMTPEQEAAADERLRQETAQKKPQQASLQKKDNFQLMTNENQLIIDDEWNF